MRSQDARLRSIHEAWVFRIAALFAFGRIGEFRLEGYLRRTQRG